MGGGSETIGRAKRAGSAPDVVDPAKTPSPGKTTGIPIVDLGPRCKREPEAEGCLDLDADQRQLLISSYNAAINAAALNRQVAIQNHRGRLLTMMKGSSMGYGFLEEVLVQVGSAWLIGRLVKGATGIKERAAETIFTEDARLTVKALNMDIDVTNLAPQLAKLNVEALRGVALQGSKGMRTIVKNAMHSGAIADEKSLDQAEFLKLLQNQISDWQTHMIQVAPTDMTDVQLAAAVHALSDPTVFSPEAQDAILQDVLDRYDAQHLADIGDGKSPGPDGKGGKQFITRKETVWVSSGTRIRLAIVEFYDPNDVGYAKDTPIKGYDGEIVPWNQTEFVSWIDDDLKHYARDFQENRVGKIKLINATGGNTGMKEVDAWATEQP